MIPMPTCQVTVVNPLGLHARAAAKFVSLAGRFRCLIHVRRGDRQVDGKSILGLLLLSAARGSALEISAEGDDAGQALAALCKLIEQGFEET
jgi:phosphocarrier protein HPr